jgi:hypothetical protein
MTFGSLAFGKRPLLPQRRLALTSFDDRLPFLASALLLLPFTHLGHTLWISHPCPQKFR